MLDRGPSSLQVESLQRCRVYRVAVAEGCMVIQAAEAVEVLLVPDLTEQLS